MLPVLRLLLGLLLLWRLVLRLSLRLSLGLVRPSGQSSSLELHLGTSGKAVSSHLLILGLLDLQVSFVEQEG